MVVLCKKALPLLVATMALASCVEDPYSHTQPQLVVEGWIDDGDFPTVFVTTSLPFTTSDTTDVDLVQHVLKWATVTVSDEEKSVVLTGRVMKHQTPPYGFTTTRIMGRSGHTYKLTVDCPPYHAEAVTTIPPKAVVDSFTVTPCLENDTLYQVMAHVSQQLDLPQGGGYKFFGISKCRDVNYKSCYMGLYKPENISPHSELPVYNLHRPDNRHFSPFFSYSDTLKIKFATLDGPSYAFWDSFEDDVSLSGSPFFSTNSNLRGNVSGGLGYWCGYGSSVYYLLPPKKPCVEN